MKAILLVRVSTKFQDADPQEGKLRDYAISQGYTEFYVIKTVESGLTLDIEQLKETELYRKLEEDSSYKTIFCTEISRISRVQEVLFAVKNHCVKNKIQLIVPNQFTLLKSDGQIENSAELHFTIYSHYAISEIKLLKERSRTARKFYVKQGLSIPGKVLFGYKRVYDEVNKKYKLVIEKEHAELVKNIFDWYLEGLPNSNSNQSSTGNIAKYCIANNLHKYTKSKRNINHLLKEMAYTGKKEFKFKNSEESNEDISIIEVPFEKIISEDVFEQVQEKMKSANSSLDKSVKTTLLSRKITCSSCQTKFVANYRSINGRISNSYRCGRRSSANGCMNKQDIGMNMLDSAVWSLLKSNNQFIKDFFEKEASHITDTIPEIENTIAFHLDELSELRTLDNQLNVADDLWRSKTVEEMLLETKITESRLEKKRDVSNKILKLERKINNQKRTLQKAKELQSNSAFVDQSIAELEARKDLVKRYIDLLINDVGIVLHTKELSVFTLYFKMPFFRNSKLKVSLSSIFDQDSSNQSLFPITLVIEKRDTNRKKLFWIAGNSSVDEEKLIIYNELSDKLESDNITNTYYFTDIRDRRIEEIEEDAVWSEDPDNDNDLNILKQIPYNMFSFVS
jgi:DNA invertase Pin-like site-specific DNA recombinase